MATSEGTWTDVHDLLTSISSFATSNGWTQDKYVSGSGSTPSELYLRLGTSQYVSIEAYINGPLTANYRGVSQLDVYSGQFHLYGNTGFNGSNAVNNQPGSSQQEVGYHPIGNWFLGPGRYKMFTDGSGTYIHVVAIAPHADGTRGGGDYQHLVFGKAETINSGDIGGEYIDATSWSQAIGDYIYWYNSRHSMIFDAASDNWTIVGQIRYDDGTGYNWKKMSYYNYLNDPHYEWVRGGMRDYQKFDIFGGLASLVPRATFKSNLALPIILYTFDGVYTSNWTYRPSFRLPDTKQISMNTLEAESIINDGTSDWQVYPIQRKRGPYYNKGGQALIGYAISAHVGIAYKIIT